MDALRVTSLRTFYWLGGNENVKRYLKVCKLINLPEIVSHTHEDLEPTR